MTSSNDAMGDPYGGISAIVLAAGGSSRFGSPKLLAPIPHLQHQPMIRVVVDAVLRAGIEDVVVVVGSQKAGIQRALGGQPVRIVENPDWRGGLSTSVKAGLKAVEERASAVVFVLADQPTITPAVIHRIVDAYRESRAPIVVPTFQGRRGNPALFDQQTFAALRQISGDQGGRSLITSGQFGVASVEVGQEAILLDVDEPAHLWALTGDGARLEAVEHMTYVKASSPHPYQTPTPAEASSLSQIAGWLVDLDGVIYRGDTVIDGAPEFVASLRREKIPFLFVTNNSSRTPEQYARRLRSMGIPAEPSEFYTSGLATAEYLASRAPAGARVLLIGMDGVREALLGAGFELIRDPAEAQYCVVGYSDRLTYDDLRRANDAIRLGAPFIGTNPDPTLPMEGGAFIPGTGAILAALAVASDVQPVVVGKPQRIILDLAIERLGVEPARCAILGDRLDTDIVGGQTVGALTILILSGATTAEMAAESDIQPDLIVKDMTHLMALRETAPR